VRTSEPLKRFEDAHYGQVACMDSLNDEIFCTGGDDGFLNFWSLRMNKLMMRSSVNSTNQGDRINHIKFVHKTNKGGGLMLIGHEDKLTVMSPMDDFKNRLQFSAPVQNE